MWYLVTLLTTLKSGSLKSIEALWLDIPLSWKIYYTAALRHSYTHSMAIEYSYNCFALMILLNHVKQLFWNSGVKQYISRIWGKMWVYTVMCCLTIGICSEKCIVSDFAIVCEYHRVHLHRPRWPTTHPGYRYNTMVYMVVLDWNVVMRLMTV